MLSNALLMSSMTGRADSLLAVIVLSMIRLEVKTCSVVDLFGLQAACDGGISAYSLSLILLVMHATRILRREDSRIIGLRFSGTFALFGF